MSTDERNDDEPVKLTILYGCADDLVGDYVENLSSGTTFVATTAELPVGTKVHLVLSFPGLVEAISIEGIVQSTVAHDKTRAGIQFTPGSQLAQVIAKIRERDPDTVLPLFHVLLVEDNRSVAKLIEDGLKRWARRDSKPGLAFVVHQAEDGRSAVEILRKENLDAVIIDVYLPHMDGARVIECARGELGLVELPIIAVSAGGDAARRSAIDAGANIFFDKPMPLRQVFETIQKLIR